MPSLQALSNAMLELTLVVTLQVGVHLCVCVGGGVSVCVWEGGDMRHILRVCGEARGGGGGGP